MKTKRKGRGLRIPNLSKTMERGANFVVVRVPVLRDGRVKRWHALFTMQSEASGDLKITRSSLLDEYFDDCEAFSDQVRRETCQVVGLFGDYTRAALTYWPKDRVKEGGLPKRLFRGLALALAKGTVEYVNGCPVDVLRLYWRPRGKRRALRLLARLRHMMRWLEPDIGNTVWRQFLSRQSTAIDVTSAFNLAIAAGFKRKNSLLAHLPSDPTSFRGGNPVPGVLKFAGGLPPRIYSFPAEAVFPFIVDGFTNDAGETDETAQLAAIMLFVGGLRTSEPFHLYTSDVQFAGGKPTIHLHHPEYGKVIDRHGYKVSRAQYLAEEYDGLMPRTTPGRNQAGWKSILGDEHGTPIFWLPIEGVVELLYAKLRRYLLVTRPSIMKQRSVRDKDHPFLLVSSGRTFSANGGKVGDPYTISALVASWQAALKRISVKYDWPELVYDRERGTTKHGARHYYGRYLLGLGLPGEIIQQCMHHKNPESWKVYTKLSPSEINAILKSAGAGDHQPISILRNSFERDMEKANALFASVR